MSYVIWYAESSQQNFECLTHYCKFRHQITKNPILFSDHQIIDHSKKNIFFILGESLTSGLEELLFYKDELKWCDDNDISVVYDMSWESLHCCIPQNNIQEVIDIIPNKFKILCNMLKGDPKLNDKMYEPFIKYAYDVRWFPMYLGFQLNLMKNDKYHISSMVSPAERKYKFSMFCGEIRKQGRFLLLAGLMAEDMLDDSFYTTYIRQPGGEAIPDPDPFDDLWVHNDEWLKWLEDFRYIDWLKDNYYSKIRVNKLFDFPDVDRNKELSSELFDAGEDNRIPIQMHESYYNIVMETFSADERPAFYSEKTFKPIVAEKPFIISGTLYQNEHLQLMGFQIFPEIFDYSFERSEHSANLKQYVENFVDEIKRVNNEPVSIFDQPSVIEKIKHNKDLMNKLSSKESIHDQLIKMLS